MKHLGDIAKINGAEIEIVDVITGGSPCQDLSIAGKRAGLAGARSGLFMEQVRIVKEMREHDRANGRAGDMVRPRFMVWENVPGAFSSNKGRDFAAVLEEIIRIAEPEAPDIEVPEKGWPTWGATTMKWEDDGAWLGECMMRNTGESPNAAVESRLSQILEVTPQEKYSLSAKACQGILRRAERRGKDLPETLKAVLLMQSENAECGWNNPSVVVPAVLCLNDQGGNVMGVSHDVSGTLRAQEHGHQPSILDMSHACDVIRDCGEVAPSLQARMETGGNQIPLTYQDVTGTLSPGAHAGSYNGQDAYNDMLVCGATPDVAHALRARASCSYREDAETYPVQNMIVRRLTPMECERLQGYPDGWTDIGEWMDSKGKRRKDADSHRYKALGNSIALPFWQWLIDRMAAHLPEGATMGSLFDGIGGFPLCWQRTHGEGTAKWASEIEEFPIAVTKLRFGED